MCLQRSPSICKIGDPFLVTLEKGSSLGRKLVRGLTELFYSLDSGEGELERSTLAPCESVPSSTKEQGWKAAEVDLSGVGWQSGWSQSYRGSRGTKALS